MVEDVPPGAVWEALCKDPLAVLCDVRTEAEWAFVGVPDLSSVGKRAVLIPWQVYPGMKRNEDFLDQLADAGVTPEHRVFFICRSGGRSRAAAITAAKAGFANAYNVAHGFDGPANGEGRRGAAAGWKAEGLPWRPR
ncbi:MAG: rhodanese-like domain-containing protein [Rhodospirillales bacterium]|nr:rhodanese-like domain-containing protein [Rhodospirillales bacterium]